MPTVLITAPTEAAAPLAETLVEERLAACVNRVPCTSTYRWEGEVVTDDEELLLAKTTAAGYEALERRVAEVHPYDVPCIERLDETDSLSAYADWVGESVDVGAGDPPDPREGTSADETTGA